MKESKAVYVTKHNIRDDKNLVYRINAKDYREFTDRYENDETNNFGCQYDSKKDNHICTCKTVSKRAHNMRYVSDFPKQTFTYCGSRSFSDIGVGSVKTLQKRKVKKIYLPETDDREVGSSKQTSFVVRKSNQKDSYYDHKRNSSKCVDGVIKYNTGCANNEKLLPIIQTKSGATCNKVSIEQRHTEIGSNTNDKNLVTTGTQYEIKSKNFEKLNEENVKSKRVMEVTKNVVNVSEQTQKCKYSVETLGKKAAVGRNLKVVEQVFSSDSLVQHIHNLEDHCFEKQSRASIDPMENKLEREYRRMFLTKDKSSKQSVYTPIPEFKSASMLRRRFEALRRSLTKKDDGKKTTGPSSHESVPSRKDVSVTSNPPSLADKSYTDTMKYRPRKENTPQDKYKPYPSSYKTVINTEDWPQTYVGSDCQGVKGMFKLWAKKINFEEEAKKAKSTHSQPSSYNPPLAIDIKKKPHKESKINKENGNKKSGRKFFFFKKKRKNQQIETNIKEIQKEPYKPSGVVAGRCEIRDGLSIKIGNAPANEHMVYKVSEGDERKRGTLFKTFLDNTIESTRTVNVRWNNSMYATSSSTAFDLMDTLYKNNGVVLKSQSEITTEDSIYYRLYTNNKVNFEQKIEAWMIPNTITHIFKEIPIKIQSNKERKEQNVEVTISDQRWFIDKSRALANKIEVVVLSNHFNKITNDVSSDYLRLNIAKDFFDVSSSDGSKQNPTSDEEVYKIVEYESDLNSNNALDKGDHVPGDIKVIVSVQDSNNINAKILETVIKLPPMHRDVVIQGSDVFIPKRCDVIGVGIITQRDMKDRKPILRIQDDLTDDDSEEHNHTNQKKCEFAESYLQEFYRHWAPLDMDLNSWRVSDTHLRSCSEKSFTSFQNQGDGTKSCPNISDDFHTSTLISSCNISSFSQCAVHKKSENTQQPGVSFSTKLFNKLRIPLRAKTGIDIIVRRFLPKDSLEVFKRRKMYASNRTKDQWVSCKDKPVSVPSIESRIAVQNTSRKEREEEEEGTKIEKERERSKQCKKHIYLPDSNLKADQISKKKIEGILSFKGCDASRQTDHKCEKHAVVKDEPESIIPEPACQEDCLKQKKACSKPDTPCCNESLECVSPKPSCDQCDLANLDKTSSGSSLTRMLCEPVPVPSCKPPICPQKKVKRCKKCQHKLPCLMYPNCKPTSSDSSESLHPSLKRSPNVCSPKPPDSPTELQQKPACPAEKLGNKEQCPNTSPKRSPNVCSPKSPDSPTELQQKPACPAEKLGNKEQCPNKRKPPECSPNQSPCDQNSKLTPEKCPHENNQFSMPMNDQQCNSVSPSISETSQTEDTNECENECDEDTNECENECDKTLEESNHSLEQKLIDECDCNNQKNTPCPIEQLLSVHEIECLPCPTQQPLPEQPKLSCLNCLSGQPVRTTQTVYPQLPSPPQQKCNKQIQHTTNGLFFKMKPTRKLSSNEYVVCDSVEKEQLRLNSREKIRIIMEYETPSTEEINKGVNIKLQDYDGKTLFERKDHTCNNLGHKPSVLGDMYKDSKVNRVSTPGRLVNDMTEENQERDVVDYKNDTSLANLIEIQFKLRITPGDKVTEVCIGNEDEEKPDTNELSKTTREVFIVGNQGKESVDTPEDVSPKNDINIKIVFKNYKSNKNKDPEKYKDDFTKKISDKFHTVSTGYSDVFVNQTDDSVFSVHTTTLHLNSSENKFETTSKPCNDLVSEGFTEPVIFKVSSQSTECLAIDGIINEIVDKLNEIHPQSYDNTNDSETNDFDALNINTGNECIDKTFNSNEKKLSQKQVFEEANTTPKNNENIRQLQDFFKIGEINVVDELANDVTYASVKPDYFRNTDSMNNYYRMGSPLTIEEFKENNTHYPTDDNSSAISTPSRRSIPQGCMCSYIAKSLNCDQKIGCQCKKDKKINEATSCDLGNMQNILLYNDAEYVDADSQVSKKLVSKTNSLDLSINKQDSYSEIENFSNTKEPKNSKSPKEKTVKSNYVKFFPYKKDAKNINHATNLDISDDDKIVLLSENYVKNTWKKSKEEKNNLNIFNAADTLQCYEAKKAVLEIYAEKRVSENGEHFAAKLPKFLYEKESEITSNYEEIATNSYRRICKRNVYRMSVKN